MQKQLDYYEASIVFICLFYLDSLTIMRQMVAVAFVFWGYKYIFEKKFWKFLIIVAIASLAHPTALIALAIYFIYNYVDYKKSIPLVVIISFIGGIGFNFITQYKLFSRFVIYLNERTSDGGSSVRVFYIILFVVCFISIINLGMGDEMSKKLLSVAMFGIAFPFVLGPQQGLRTALYFNVSYIFLIPQILAKVSIKNKYICMVPFYLFYITFLLIDMKNNSGYSPYTFIFMQE